MPNLALHLFGCRDRLMSLSLTQQADDLRHGSMYSWLLRGGIIAVLRFGHYEAAKMLASAGVPIHVAYGIIMLAKKNGYNQAR